MTGESEIKRKDVNGQTKDSRFFVVSGFLVACITMLLLAGFTYFMGRQVSDVTDSISNVYMAEINLQLQQKFKSIMEVRLTQVDRILKEISPDVCDDCETVCEIITEEASSRSLSFAGFLDEDYKLFPVYGAEDIAIGGDNDIEASIAYDGNVLEYAADKDGNRYLMYGRGTTDFVLGDGKHSTAFVVGIGMEVMDSALFLDSEEGNIYTHVINHNGDFIISNGFIEGDNYFDGVVNTEIADAREAEKCISELKHAIEVGTQYNFSYILNGENFYVCCSPFSDNSEWYYVTVMSSTVFDGYFDRINQTRTEALIIVLAILLCSIVWVVRIYYRMNQKKIEELNEAKMLAIKESNAKTEFLSSMSHDIRTPMNAVIGMTNIALDHIDDTERVKYCLDKVVVSSKHLLSMINDILDISKIESGNMQLSIRTASLKSMVDDLMALSQAMLKEKGQSFDVFIHQVIAEKVYCDDTRLYQILVNIVSNAFKYTDEGGRILIDINQEPSEQGEDYVRTCFKVIDNGIGMSPEFMARLFDKFEREENDVTRNSLGTGLGMAISKQLTDLMGGSLEVESTVNEGSVFTLSVDLRIAERFEMAEKLPAWDVLVVDDDIVLCETAVSNLRDLGVNAEYITESRKAVELIEARREEGKEFDFVLLDWSMPDMDGVETIRRIRATGNVELPVFLISAYDLGDVEDHIDLTEFEGFIAKPLFKSRLYQVLGKYAEGCVSAASTALQEPAGRRTFTGKRVLVAEDAEINWEIEKEALTSADIEADIAENGKECIEKLCGSPVGYYDMILMDIRMPVMNGIDATKAIRKLDREDKDLPIVAMTANAFSEDIQECLASGMNAHIAKPIDINNFFVVLHRFLDN